MLIAIYRLLIIFFSPLIAIFVLYRVFTGKEELAHFSQRLGFASIIRPPNKQLIWLHGASVGESIAAAGLIKKLIDLYPSHQFLLTTGTITAARLVKNNMPINVIHQYIPLDLSFCTKRFINYWSPQVAIFIDSEIWPNILDATSKKCPIILANAIISNSSVIKWSLLNSWSREIFSKFSLILAQDQANADKFLKLGAQNIINAGSLKFNNEKPECNQQAKFLLAQQVIGRRVLLAASTHQGDEEYIVECYKRLKPKYPDLLLLIAPRHAHRLGQIKTLLQEKKLIFAVRSHNQLISITTDVYVADTLGELGLFYSLAEISFIGGSIKNGGHNIIEPSFFNTIILFGPDMKNFANIAQEYLHHKAAIMCDNLDEMSQTIDYLLSNLQIQSSYHSAAEKLLDSKNSITKLYLKSISTIIDNA